MCARYAVHLPAFLAAWLFACLVVPGLVAASESVYLDTLQLEDAVSIAVRNRSEVTAANARAEALAARPAILGALEDPMISPSIDHYPFDMPKAQDGMGEGGGGQRYDWSISVEQRFSLSGVRGHRREAARADAERAKALAQNTELDSLWTCSGASSCSSNDAA